MAIRHSPCEILVFPNPFYPGDRRRGFFMAEEGKEMNNTHTTRQSPRQEAGPIPDGSTLHRALKLVATAVAQRLRQRRDSAIPATTRMPDDVSVDPAEHSSEQLPSP